MKPSALVFPYGDTLISGVIKSLPQDFIVLEELGFEPSGEGEHLFLQVEKSGLSTPELIAKISGDYSIHPRHIGFSGMKDKNALTTQWLSLHLPGQKTEPKVSSGDGYHVLRALRNRSKLRRGSHRSNFFRVCIRAVDDLPVATREQLEAIANRGMANYFGSQRFGRRQDNVEQALAQLAGSRLKRTRRGMLLSALRSHLFNQVLSRRISQGHWSEPLEGDVFMLRGSHSIFSEALDATLLQRHASLDIASTASLYGSGQNQLSGPALQIEQQVHSEHGEITSCLDNQDVKLQMRPLRVVVEDLQYELDAAGKSLQLELRLPAGSYLTTLLDHFISVTEPDQARF